MSGLRQDFRYTVRMLRKSPVFTAAVVITLALGIGANQAIFSLIDAVLLRSLPVREPGGLFFLENVGSRYAGGSPPYPCFERFQRQARSFAGMAAFTDRELALRVDGRTEQVACSRVSGAYYQVLGVRAYMGRLLVPDDDRLDPPVAVISYDYWRKRFGGDPGVFRKTVSWNGVTFAIVGVAPPEFHGLMPGRSEDVILPITAGAARQLQSHSSWWHRVVARVKPGVRREQARAEVDAIFQQYMSEHPAREEDRREWAHHMELDPAARGLGELRRQFSRPLWALMAVTALVLLIACANKVNLLLERAVRRRREFAVRVAIGAGRGRLIRQLLLETAVLVGSGALASVLAGEWMRQALTAYFASGSRALFLDARLDWRALGFSTAVAVAVTLASGAVPILRAMRADPQTDLRAGSGSRRLSGVGRAMAVFQVAVTMVLLAGAALFLRTLGNLHAVDPGFRAEGVVAVSVRLLDSAYREARQEVRLAVWERLLERVQRLPGVESASVSAMTPMDGDARGIDFYAPGYAGRSTIAMNTVSADYFRTLGIRVLQGRVFEGEAQAVAVLNRSAAEHYFAGRDALGAVVRVGTASYRVVGVVEDSRHEDLRRAARRFIYLPIGQPVDRGMGMTLAARGRLDAAVQIAAIERLVRDAGPDLVVTRAGTVEGQIEETLVRERAVTFLSSAFAGVGLLLAAVGLYGVLAYSVAGRTREIGIRLALGAEGRRIAGGILRQTAGMVAAGLAVGVPASIVLARFVEGLLFGVKPADGLTLAGAAAVLFAAGVAAGYVPARRAGRVDPLEALRQE